ncbi:MAG: glycosyltransferase family 2 protein [Candidatus Altiarchaeota archaeon]|nr:glycosyltransferase family 2 protein [Candidatus Altiarchaeota archaeon]
MKVTTIIPAYNSEDYIEKSIDSVIDQTDELIIVDDNSTDNTIGIIEKYRNDKKARIVAFSRNMGQGYVRNYGAKIAKTPLILFLDSDQTVEKDWLDKAKKALLDDEKIAAIGGYRKTPKRTFSQKLMNILRIMSFDENPEWISEDATLYRKNIFLDVGGFNEKLRVGEAFGLCHKMRERGYLFRKIDISVMHLGEPDNFMALLKRQWKYGKYGRHEKLPSYMRVLRLLIFITPLGILASVPLYLHIFQHDKNLSKDISTLIKLPIGYYLFMFTHQLSFFLNLIGLNKIEEVNM